MIRDTKPPLAEALESLIADRARLRLVHVVRNHGTFDPLQAPQYQLDVKTAAQLAREYGYNRGRADGRFGRRLTTRLGGRPSSPRTVPSGNLG